MERISTDQFKTLKAKRSKYGNKKTIYKGEKYDSKKEADYACTLDSLRRAKSESDRVVRVERQVPYPIYISDKKITTYYADFVVYYEKGNKEVVDVKGFKTSIYRLKKKLVEASYGIIIKEI